MIVPLSAVVAAVFEAGEPVVYRHGDASETNARQVNAAVLSGAREFVISRDPKVIPSDLLERWAKAAEDQRVSVASELL